MRESFITEFIIMAGVVVGIWFFYQYGMNTNRTKTPAKPAQAVTPPAAPAPAKDQADLKASFNRAAVAYPPRQVTFLAFKQERVMEVWAMNNGSWTYIHNYPILAASGQPGPKLREGDRQVPEGIYKVLWLNPNSHFHLSMKIDYPNAFDTKYARLEGRHNPGSDIFIHGEQVSIGCLAMGNAAIEQLYSLVEDTGTQNIQVIIAPHDMRRQPPRVAVTQPQWLPQLYANIQQALEPFALGS